MPCGKPVRDCGRMRVAGLAANPVCFARQMPGQLIARGNRSTFKGHRVPYCCADCLAARGCRLRYQQHRISAMGRWRTS